MAAPVQVVINPGNFHEDVEHKGGGPSTDFFAHQDAAFNAHRDALKASLLDIARQLIAQTPVSGGVGIVIVHLRRTALAKSHRPFHALFKADLTPCVGGLDLGQLLFRVTPESIRTVMDAIDAAEPHTTIKNNYLGVPQPHPTRRRSEVGAIEKIEIYNAAHRRNFNISMALSWFAERGTAQNYEVTLFDLPRPIAQSDLLSSRERTLFQSFQEGLARLDGGLVVQRQRTIARAEAPRLSVRLDRSGLPPRINLLTPPLDRRIDTRQVAAFDPTPERHSQLLHFLEEHPLVRSIRLPGRVLQSDERVISSALAQTLPSRDTSRTYPKVGVIDSGVGAVANDWVIGRWDFLAASDVDDSHGTFISGLLVAGSALNPQARLSEVDGVEIYDARIFPRATSYDTYFSNLDQFFDEVENAIVHARTTYNVRVFNFSLNIETPVTPDTYSQWAVRLDRWADEHDVVLFVSAGNFRTMRPEWPQDSSQALAMLATVQGDTVFLPAESARHASVAALNPPVPGVVAYAPARYSRRGPGLRSLCKPDLAHIGGVGSPPPGQSHGLTSVNGMGQKVDACGTSYASPLVAKTAARLDTLVEGGLSRETMLALLTHHARHPEPLTAKSCKPIARHLVGHGMPPNAEAMLEGGDHEITLVFATRLPRNKELAFPFTWPNALTTDGSCRGTVKLTLVSSPPIDSRYGAECVRITLNAALQQYNPDKDRWEGRLDAAYLPDTVPNHPYEADLVEHGLKWSPVKIWSTTRKGIGKSSTWRLNVKYLTRAQVQMPADGVPFTAILTIRDPEGVQPVFSQMRQTLAAQAVAIEDIRTAVRVVTRV